MSKSRIPTVRSEFRNIYHLEPNENISDDYIRNQEELMKLDKWSSVKEFVNELSKIQGIINTEWQETEAEGSNLSKFDGNLNFRK